MRYAPINANGTLGAWSTTSSLPGARCGNVEAVTVANGCMYAAGGYDNNNVTSAVYYAADQRERHARRLADQRHQPQRGP